MTVVRPFVTPSRKIGNRIMPESSAIPASPAPQQIVLQQPSYFGRFGKLLLFGLVVCVVIMAGMWSQYDEYYNPPGGPVERFHSLSETAQKKVAIINVAGTLFEGEGFIKRQIDQAREDADVVAVVLRIDSPGGTVTASDYLYHHLKRLREDRGLPIVVSMGSLCASGGYYMAMAVGDAPESIFAEPTTWTGSIGVVIPHYDLSGLLASWEVKDDSIASHSNKLMGSFTRELPPEERAKERELLQLLVNESFERFKEVVRSGRPAFRGDKSELSEVATGQIFSADQALAYGLVDKIGFIEDAVARATELAGVSADGVRCVEYVEPPGAIEALFGASAKSLVEGRSRLDLGALLDLTAPRAYYLCSWLPSLVRNSK
jgi:protease-4